MTEHYLDNSATTRVSQLAAKKALQIMTECYGNPSSLHTKGMQAEQELIKARKIIADSIKAKENEIYFTSGGTEANNTAIFGTAKAKLRQGKKIVTTAIEHSSVLEACEALQKQGYEVVYLAPNENGIVTAEALENAVDSDTILVSVMAVNNETGAVMPIEHISKIIKNKKSNALFHTDMVQAYGKIHIKASKIGADLISLSAHKVHAPKGVGALYVKSGVRIFPLHFGGEQERKLRPGTEALPLIGAFGSAVSEFDIDKNMQYVKELNEYAKGKLLSLDGVYLNSPENALPYVLNVSVLGIRSETMLHHLEASDIFVSSGSACAKGKKSHVLKALGLSEKRADSAIRISFSKLNTKEDIDALYEAVKIGTKTLVRK
ncbi:MAG: cysteine desulfurase family protein [Acutalibacteraceae bacterium]